MAICGREKKTCNMKIDRDNGNMRCHPQMNNFGSWSVEMGQDISISAVQPFSDWNAHATYFQAFFT